MEPLSEPESRLYQHVLDFTIRPPMSRNGNSKLQNGVPAGRLYELYWEWAAACTPPAPLPADVEQLVRLFMLTPRGVEARRGGRLYFLDGDYAVAH